MSLVILGLQIRFERDVVLSRQRARQVAALVGLDKQDQTRIATAVSEIARNAFTYASGGRVEFRIEGTTAPQVLCIEISDSGPGIARLDEILAGRYRSSTGMGAGILGSRRLMDRFEIRSKPGEGTTVLLKKLLPRQAPLIDMEAMRRITNDLAWHAPRDPLEEVQLQNQELLRALEDVTRRQEELTALNRELEDTNRGVVALYAELDEKADHLRRADDVKSRFISNMSHEFRTPVNSIQALTRMLLERVDGDLSVEQERQILFIREAADALSDLVNDLLDLAKVAAGKTVVRPTEFEVANLFGALRGMLRPLLVNESVNLVFEEATSVPPLYTDEGKISQILRNFISNALKFTERGEVHVSATPRPEGMIAFSVRDTGIGIEPEDQERIFHEFTQVDNPVQRRVRGTGLGLPLCRRLAELLGGHISVESTSGVGSTFTALIPAVFEARTSQAQDWQLDPERIPVLVVEDRPETLALYERYLSGSLFQMFATRTLREGRDALAAVKPKAIVLDILLPGEEGWDFLAEIKRSEQHRDVAMIVATTVPDEQKGRSLGADAYLVKPVDRHSLIQTLTRLTRATDATRILIVDDEEVARYILRQQLAPLQPTILETSSGVAAMALARAEHPDLIFLDLTMSDADGLDVLQQLKSDPQTQNIPVIVVTARRLDEAGRRALLGMARAILPKDRLSREHVRAVVDEALRSIGGKAGVS
jgi:signal transduction histidine kinase/CheY-like chemotaxis protein